MRQDFEAPEILWEMATIIIWIAAFILPSISPYSKYFKKDNQQLTWILEHAPKKNITAFSNAAFYFQHGDLRVLFDCKPRWFLDLEKKGPVLSPPTPFHQSLGCLPMSCQQCLHDPLQDQTMQFVNMDTNSLNDYLLGCRGVGAFFGWWFHAIFIELLWNLSSQQVLRNRGVQPKIVS